MSSEDFHSKVRSIGQHRTRLTSDHNAQLHKQTRTGKPCECFQTIFNHWIWIVHWRPEIDVNIEKYFNIAHESPKNQGSEYSIWNVSITYIQQIFCSTKWVQRQLINGSGTPKSTSLKHAICTCKKKEQCQRNAKQTILTKCDRLIEINKVVAFYYPEINEGHRN